MNTRGRRRHRPQHCRTRHCRTRFGRGQGSYPCPAGGDGQRRLPHYTAGPARREAVDLMRQHIPRRLPAVEDGQPVDVLPIGDPQSNATRTRRRPTSATLRRTCDRSDDHVPRTSILFRPALAATVIEGWPGRSPIIVEVDGSPRTHQALEWAAVEAGAHRSRSRVPADADRRRARRACVHQPDAHLCRPGSVSQGPCHAARPVLVTHGPDTDSGALASNGGEQAAVNEGPG
jgi:hypothetical protein